MEPYLQSAMRLLSVLNKYMNTITIPSYHELFYSLTFMYEYIIL